MPGSGATTPTPSGLCVAWAPPGWTRDPKLERELTRPGLTLQYARDDFETVALLCTDFAKHGPKAPRAMILMLIEPLRLVGLRDALQAIANRLPVVHLWVFDPSRTPVLRGITQFELTQLLEKAAKPQVAARDVVVSAPTWVGPVVAEASQRWTTLATTDEAQRSPSKPTPLPPRRPAAPLRLTDDAPPVARAVTPVERSEGEDSHASANPPLLTNEELTMLLGETDPRSNGSNPR
jgi:hypothetical protein